MDDGIQIPDGVTVATPEMVQALYREWVLLPEASRRTGSEVKVLVKGIPRSDYYAMLPPGPPGSEFWSDKERDAKTLEWLDSLTPEARKARTLQLAEITYEVVARGTLLPPLTVAQARDYLADAQAIAQKILDLSGLAPTTPTEQAPPP